MHILAHTFTYLQYIYIHAMDQPAKKHDTMTCETHILACTCIYIQIHASTFTYLQYMHIHAQTCTNISIVSYMQIHAKTCTYMHIHAIVAAIPQHAKREMAIFRQPISPLR